MTEIESFGECLRRWMRQRGYTNAHLAQLTHEKSGTTISRLVNDQCTAQRCAIFLEELLANVPDFTPEETSALRRSVEVTRFGKAQFRANQVFETLMTDAQGLSPVSETACWDELLAVLTPWAADEPCEVLCFGCFDARVLGTLGALLRREDTEALTVRHYFAEELHVDLIFLLEHTLLMLNDPRYHLISIHGGEGLRASSIAMQDAILLRNASGATRLILPAAGDEPHVQDFGPEADLFGFYERALAADEALQHRYSSDFGRGSATDYVAFLEACLSYENGRSVFHLKPDPGTEYMPVEIVRANFQEWIAQYPEYAYAEEELVELYTRRHQSIYGTRRQHFLVLSKDAMTAFARTGRTTDHLFCLRPFTPEERVAILTDLIEQTEHNPNFVLRMLRDPAAMPQHQLIAYEELGLLICDTVTDYSLENYSEIFLSSPLAAAQFKTFMMDVVIRDMTENAAETIRFLRGLIERVR